MSNGYEQPEQADVVEVTTPDQALSELVKVYLSTRGDINLVSPLVAKLNESMGGEPEIVLSRTNTNRYTITARRKGGLDVLKEELNIPRNLGGKKLDKAARVMQRAGIPVHC